MRVLLPCGILKLVSTMITKFITRKAVSFNSFFFLVFMNYFQLNLFIFMLFGTGTSLVPKKGKIKILVACYKEVKHGKNDK
jgi:hypothetical protein